MIRPTFDPDGSLSWESVNSWLNSLGDDWLAHVYKFIAELSTIHSDSQAVMVLQAAIAHGAMRQSPTYGKIGSMMDTLQYIGGRLGSHPRTTEEQDMLERIQHCLFD